MEIERKFTVKTLPENLDQYPCKIIEQGYLCTKPVLRVRRKGEEYWLTFKGEGLLVREEHEFPLEKEAYHNLLTKVDGRIIQKRRDLIPRQEYVIELDVFGGDLAGLVVAEVDFPSVEAAVAFVPPDWFEEDVTQNPAYSNANLSKI